jgi:hypothetical protein
MIKHNQDGAVNGVAVSLIFTVILLLGSLGFGFWAFSSREDYKNHSDAKSAAAAEKPSPPIPPRKTSSSPRTPRIRCGPTTARKRSAAWSSSSPRPGAAT